MAFAEAQTLSFFVSLVPMIYFFIQHKVHRIPGGKSEVRLRLDCDLTMTTFTAYTQYSFFEWTLIIMDVLFDSIAEQEFSDASLEVNYDRFTRFQCILRQFFYCSCPSLVYL